MSARANSQPAAAPNSAAVHDPISFLHPRLKHNRMAQFAASVLDITQGVSVCLELVHSSSQTRMMNDDSSPEDAQVPILDIVDTDRLLRLATASANLMALHAEKHIEWINKYLEQEAN